MQSERWIQEELEWINPRYFAQYDEQDNRWHIRKWHSLNRKRNFRLNSKDIMKVCRQDDIGRDVGYQSLDRRALRELKEGLYWARHAMTLAHQIDRQNEKHERKIKEEEDYLHRRGARQIWDHFKSKSIDVGG